MAEGRGIGDVADIASIISGITSDPEKMRRLKSVFDPGDGAGLKSADDTRDADVRQGVFERAPGSEERRRLVEALSPFLSKERREKAKTLLTVMALLESGAAARRKEGE